MTYGSPSGPVPDQCQLGWCSGTRRKHTISSNRYPRLFNLRHPQFGDFSRVDIKQMTYWDPGLSSYNPNMNLRRSIAVPIPLDSDLYHGLDMYHVGCMRAGEPWGGCLGFCTTL